MKKALSLLIFLIVAIVSTTGASSANDSLIVGSREFRVTDNRYKDTMDLVVAVRNELGNDWEVADWTELKNTFGGTHESARSLADFLKRGASVTRGGKKWYSGNRSYFVAPHYQSPPGNFMVHDHIQNHMVSLGSWNGTRPILAVRDYAR